MSPELPASERDQLQQMFVAELVAGQEKAAGALERLARDPRDGKALRELHGFFHRVAGAAAPVGHELLGRLAAACEGAADLLEARALPVTPEARRIFEDGLAGVEYVVGQSRPPGLPGEPKAPLEPPASLPVAPLASPGRVLVVDDDPFSARLIDSVLRGAGFSSSYCCESARAFEVIQAESPDLLILDVLMPEVDGFDLCARVRQDASFQHLPIIFVTRRGDVEQRVRGLQVGGNDYVAKPFEPQELVARVRSHLQRHLELRELAIRDGLTRCYNQKYFKQRLEQELVRARRYQTELTLGMLDLDHFKRVNDTFGHPAGDVVLAHLASILVASVRSTDVVARYGGEEFGLLLIEAALPEAAIITDRLRERVARHDFALPSPGGHELTARCTVSIGLATLREEDSAQALLQRADGALYEAKLRGRNQVRVVGG